MRQRFFALAALVAISSAPVSTRAQEPAPTTDVASPTPEAAPEGGLEARATQELEARSSSIPASTPSVADEALLCAETAHDRASASVVRVESGTAVGSGFLALDASHVVTSFRTVRDGHATRVVDAAGNARSARIVVTAPDDDLALLALATPLPGAPLPVAEAESLRVGMRIVAIGHPYVRGRDRITLGLRGEGLFEQTLSEGVVSALGPRSLSTDARLASGSVGGPVVDCEGQVVGAVSIARIGMMEQVFVAASSVAIADLVSRAQREEGYGGRIAPYFGLGIAAAFEDPGWPLGVYLMVGLNVFDAFVLAGRVHYLQRSDAPSSDVGVLELFDQRYRGDAYVAWRQLVTFGPGAGFHFELGAGASVTSLHRRTRSASIDESTGVPLLRTSYAEDQRWAVRPMLVLNVDVGPLMIGYAVELDVQRRMGMSDLLRVQHLFDLGVRF